MAEIRWRSEFVADNGRTRSKRPESYLCNMQTLTLPPSAVSAPFSLPVVLANSPSPRRPACLRLTGALLIAIAVAAIFCVTVCVWLCRAVVGELDEERDLAIDYSQVRAEPLKPVVH